MSMTHAPVSGSCLCGTVRYEIDGPLNMMVHCHCSMCRKHHGASFATFVSAPLMGLRWSSGKENIQSYASSEKGQRSFCRTCGSVTPSIADELDLVIAPAGNLLGDIDARPEAHWFVTSRAPWQTITDGLPQYEEYPDEFGTTGVTRPVIEAPKEGAAGSCLCGDVAFEIKGAAIRMVHCHCTRCRRARSSAHSTNAAYKTDAFRWIRGESQVRFYKVPDAQRFSVCFCERCGGAAPHFTPARDMVIVPAGSFDTDPQSRPEAHMFVGSKANWYEISDRLPQFEGAIR